MPIGHVVSDGHDSNRRRDVQAVRTEMVPCSAANSSCTRSCSASSAGTGVERRRITADIHYTAARHYDPAGLNSDDFDPFSELCPGPLNAAVSVQRARQHVGPRVMFRKVPPVRTRLPLQDFSCSVGGYRRRERADDRDAQGRCGEHALRPPLRAERAGGSPPPLGGTSSRQRLAAARGGNIAEAVGEAVEHLARGEDDVLRPVAGGMDEGGKHHRLGYRRTRPRGNPRRRVMARSRSRAYVCRAATRPVGLGAGCPGRSWRTTTDGSGPRPGYGAGMAVGSPSRAGSRHVATTAGSRRWASAWLASHAWRSRRRRRLERLRRRFAPGTRQRVAVAEEAVRELHESRARIAAGAERERRRIERDLHDGAQQRLVALRIELELTEELVRRDPERGASAACTSSSTRSTRRWRSCARWRTASIRRCSPIAA